MYAKGTNKIAQRIPIIKPVLPAIIMFYWGEPFAIIKNVTSVPSIIKRYQVHRE